MPPIVPNYGLAVLPDFMRQGLTASSSLICTNVGYSHLQHIFPHCNVLASSAFNIQRSQNYLLSVQQIYSRARLRSCPGIFLALQPFRSGYNTCQHLLKSRSRAVFGKVSSRSYIDQQLDFPGEILQLAGGVTEYR